MCADKDKGFPYIAFYPISGEKLLLALCQNTWVMTAALTVADVFACLGHEARLAILRGLDQEESMPAVADELGMHRGTLQDHIERLIDCRLVYRPGDEARTYALTPFGDMIVAQLDELVPDVERWVKQVREAEQVVREELEGVPLEEEEREQVVQREVWTRVIEGAEDV